MQLNIDEALRYLGAGNEAPDALRLEVEEAAKLLISTVSPRYVYRVFPLIHDKEDVLLSGAEVRLTGHMAAKMLADCNQAALLACTLGTKFDSLLRTEQARDMSRAVILDACGSCLVESGCDMAERELKARFPKPHLTDRFSPGYGDLPLQLQPDILSALDAGRRIGLYVTESLLLNPQKSVTAIIGLAEKAQPARIRGCEYCSINLSCTKTRLQQREE